MDPFPRSSSSKTLLEENIHCTVILEEDLDMSSSSSDQESTELSAETVRAVHHQDDWDRKEHSDDESINGNKHSIKMKTGDFYQGKQRKMSYF